MERRGEELRGEMLRRTMESGLRSGERSSQDTGESPAWQEYKG